MSSKRDFLMSDNETSTQIATATGRGEYNLLAKDFSKTDFSGALLDYGSLNPMKRNH